MTTTSEKILSEMQRMGKMKIKDLCAQMGWQYQKFRIWASKIHII